MVSSYLLRDYNICYNEYLGKEVTIMFKKLGEFLANVDWVKVANVTTLVVLGATAVSSIANAKRDEKLINDAVNREIAKRLPEPKSTE